MSPRYEENKKIWFDGKLIDWKVTKIHIVNHSLHYGTAAFEGIRCYNGLAGPVIFRLNDHVKRLCYSAKVIGHKINFSVVQLKSAILGTVKANDFKECYIRPLVFFESGKVGVKAINFSKVSIMAWPWQPMLDPKGTSASISRYIRLHPQSVDINAKISGYYSNSFLASLAVNKKNEEAIMLDWRGYVAEGPGENIFMVKNKKLYTPKPDSILPGITRNSILKISRNMDIKSFEKNIKPLELRLADEVFFTGTAVEVCPVLKIDGRKIGDGVVGPVTRKIKEEYGQIVRGQNNRYKKWLTHV